MSWQDADEREGNGRHDHEGNGEGLEPSHHQHVDEQEHHREGDSQIAEDFDGHLPFAVPLKGGFFQILGGRGVVARHHLPVHPE